LAGYNRRLAKVEKKFEHMKQVIFWTVTQNSFLVGGSSVNYVTSWIPRQNTFK
jgi:hypothetical protein